MTDHITHFGRDGERRLADGSAPHFTVSWGQSEDGSYFAQIRLVGLNSDAIAAHAANVLAEKFCEGELNAH